MSAQYLYPRQRQIEVASALYAGGLGLFTGLSDAIGGNPPLGWLGLNRDGQMTLAALLVAVSAVWALGIRINGRWMGSPFLRLAAMMINTSIAGFAVWQGHGSSASYTYGWIAFFLLVGTVNAGRDCHRSLKGARVWTLN